jgi:hypothetical protein
MDASTIQRANQHTGQQSKRKYQICQTSLSQKISANYIDIEEEYGLSSDHSGVILTLSETIIGKEANPTLVNKLTNWEGFKGEVTDTIQLLGHLRTIEQPEEEAENFIKIIQNAAWKNTPALKRKTMGNNYPKEIRELIAEKKRARKRWQQTRTPANKTRLNNLNLQLKRAIQEAKNESRNSYLRELTNEKETDYSLWKATKRMKRPVVHIPPIRKEDGSWARNDEQNAELCADYLEQIFKPNEQQSRNEDQLILSEENEDNPSVTPKEVANEIKRSINPTKAKGFDLITDEILKQLPRKGVVKLTHLINTSFRLKYTPQVWKIVEVIMIPKQGKPLNEVTSHRPITLLPVVSKLFEKLLFKRLKVIIENKTSYQRASLHLDKSILPLNKCTD